MTTVSAVETRPFGEALKDAQRLVSDYAMDCLAGDDLLLEAMRYAIIGGKMLRGFLVLESARLHGVDQAAALRAALAIECIHAYSLVHDDLPCMDDDDLRRGLPTVHVQVRTKTTGGSGGGCAADALPLSCCQPPGMSPATPCHHALT